MECWKHNVPQKFGHKYFFRWLLRVRKKFIDIVTSVFFYHIKISLKITISSNWKWSNFLDLLITIADKDVVYHNSKYSTPERSTATPYGSQWETISPFFFPTKS